MNKTKKHKKNEKCILCKTPLKISKDLPVTQRLFYIDGAGQLCKTCYYNLYELKRDKNEN